MSLEYGDGSVFTGLYSFFSNRLFAYLDLYTPFGIIEATIWSSQLKEYSDYVKKGNCLAILGRKREEHFFVEKIKPYNTWLEQMRKKGVAV